MESSNEDRALWGLSRRGGVIVFAFLAAVLVTLLYDEITQAPIAAQRADDLLREFASIEPPLGILRRECYTTSAPHKALVGCTYFRRDDEGSVEAHYEKVLVRKGWRACGERGERLAGYRSYCRGERTAVIEWGIAGLRAGSFRVHLIWDPS